MQKKMIILMLSLSMMFFVPNVITLHATDYLVICAGSLAGAYCVYWTDNGWSPYSGPTMSPCARMRICVT